MEKGSQRTIGRRIFLAGSLLSGAALASCANRKGESADSRPIPKVLTPREYDYEAMMAVLRTNKLHKQVFLAVDVSRTLFGVLHLVQLDMRELYGKMQQAMNGYDFSLAASHGKLATLGVLVGDSVILALNGAMWEKYGIGKRYNLPKSNIYYNAKSNLNPDVSPNDPNGLYQDWSAQAVLKRGGSFMVCHNALTGFANSMALKVGSDCASVLAELSQNVLPGFLVVPSGLVAVQLAQENGWKLFTPV
jgi:intracellular sulfur oxidation DsrE/DsrF family protein